MDAHPANPESLRDGARAMPNGPHLTYPLDRDGRLTAFKTPLAFAASISVCCRSQMNLRSISATAPSRVTRHVCWSCARLVGSRHKHPP
jgi:hypothetical protein